MAHLEVRPKPSRPWWLWVLVVIILIALGAMVFKQCGTVQEEHPSIAGNSASSEKHKAIAATGPDWDKVNFNATPTSDTLLKATEIYTRSDGNYTIYSLGENLLFAQNSTQIIENGKEKLKSIAEALNKKFPTSTIGIFGNTDTAESEDAKKLGMLRANVVKEWLAKQGKIDANQLSVRSLGHNQPVASNETTEGRQLNRNVAIVVFPKN